MDEALLDAARSGETAVVLALFVLALAAAVVWLVKRSDRERAEHATTLKDIRETHAAALERRDEENRALLDKLIGDLRGEE